MAVFLIVYLLVEIVNIVYTSRFGLAAPMDQPAQYIIARKILRVLKFLFAFFAGVSYFPSSVFVSVLAFATPFIVERALFVYCRLRERNRLIKLYTNPIKKPETYAKVFGSTSDKIMTEKEAGEVASTMIDTHIRNKDWPF